MPYCCTICVSSCAAARILLVFMGATLCVRRFGPHRGSYMFHCHNLVHEDDDMLRAFNVSVGPEVDINSRVKAPFVTLNGKVKAIYSNWGYNNPLYAGTSAKASWLWPKINQKYIETQVSLFVLPTTFWPLYGCCYLGPFVQLRQRLHTLHASQAWPCYG
jgi:hypothetical protein